MGTIILLQRYLKGDFEIDTTKLSNEDKVKYLQTTNLVKELIRAVDGVVAISKTFQESKEEKEQEPDESITKDEVT